MLQAKGIVAEGPEEKLNLHRQQDKLHLAADQWPARALPHSHPQKRSQERLGQACFPQVQLPPAKQHPHSQLPQIHLTISICQGDRLQKPELGTCGIVGETGKGFAEEG
jgi:hypothetical protein